MELVRLVEEHARGFDFRTSALSSPWVPAFTVVAYLAAIPLLQRFMSNRKPLSILPLVVVHNMLLAAGSFVLLFLIGFSLYERHESAGETFCDPSNSTNYGMLPFLYYVNYIVKFYELLDTLILTLRKKPVIFLDAYHHPATLVLCWSQLYARVGLQWIPIVANLAVHSVMYLYYGLSAMKIRCWWKKYITMFQITQFVVDLVVIFSAYANRAACDYLDCAWCLECSSTSYWAATFGAMLLSSYLLLFVNFFRIAYNKPIGSVTGANKNAKSNGVKANGAKTNGEPLKNGFTRKKPRSKKTE